MAIGGLKIRDRTTGVEILSSLSKFSRFLGQVNTGTSNGSITVPLSPGMGRVWFSWSDFGQPSANTVPPQIVVSGNIISWNWNVAGTRRGVTIVYGVY